MKSLFQQQKQRRHNVANRSWRVAVTHATQYPFHLLSTRSIHESTRFLFVQINKTVGVMNLASPVGVLGLTQSVVWWIWPHQLVWWIWHQLVWWIWRHQLAGESGPTCSWCGESDKTISWRMCLHQALFAVQTDILQKFFSFKFRKHKFEHFHRFMTTFHIKSFFTDYCGVWDEDPKGHVQATREWHRNRGCDWQQCQPGSQGSRSTAVIVPFSRGSDRQGKHASSPRGPITSQSHLQSPFNYCANHHNGKCRSQSFKDRSDCKFPFSFAQLHPLCRMQSLFSWQMDSFWNLPFVVWPLESQFMKSFFHVCWPLFANDSCEVCRCCFWPAGIAWGDMGYSRCGPLQLRTSLVNSHHKITVSCRLTWTRMCWCFV